ncbi:isochorismate synthase [Gordonia sp. (in: high G+C Gram-positive bacteria)]|uniref:isochorismate synthase n=1 Tax=Gordonia sp. (in: high G+C Gram-positive bacteria) TaxID=84139 RepID=UPI003F98A669
MTPPLWTTEPGTTAPEAPAQEPAATEIHPMHWRSSTAEVSADTSITVGPSAQRSTDLGAAIDRAARRSTAGVAFGALPFDRTAASTVITPADITHIADRPVTQLKRASSRPSEPSDYLAGVSSILSRIADGTVDKVVLARYSDMLLESPSDPLDIAARLAVRNPSAHVFALPVGPGRHLVGASPELLLAKTGANVRSHPLAGSARRTGDPVTDEQAADRLRRSDKDLREHRYVVEAICDLLSPHCRRLSAADPDVVATDSMLHLGTEITAELDDPHASVSRLAAELHPTPAVCGTPRAAAGAAINETESFDRGFFAGAVGWQDRAGDGEWAVSIRCGEVTAERVRAYAGAGIVAGSDPTAELTETEGKLSTLLAALG